MSTVIASSNFVLHNNRLRSCLRRNCAPYCYVPHKETIKMLLVSWISCMVIIRQHLCF